MTFSCVRIGAVAAAVFACASPSAAAVPGASPRHPAEILAEFGADDLAWTAPRMRVFLHDWFGVSRPDQPLCAPAGKTMPGIDIVCEAQPAALPDRMFPPTLVLGVAGTDVASARIVAVISNKAIVSDRWGCREVLRSHSLCVPRGSDRGRDEAQLQKWAGGLPNDELELLRWNASLPELRYVQRRGPEHSNADLPLVYRGLYRVTVDETVWLEHGVAVGRACRSLSEANATIMLDALKKRRAMIQEFMTEADRPWAALYLQTVRARPLRSTPSRPTYATDTESCRRFAAPEGMLWKLQNPIE